MGFIRFTHDALRRQLACIGRATSFENAVDQPVLQPNTSSRGYRGSRIAQDIGLHRPDSVALLRYLSAKETVQPELVPVSRVLEYRPYTD